VWQTYDRYGSTGPGGVETARRAPPALHGPAMLYPTVTDREDTGDTIVAEETPELSVEDAAALTQISPSTIRRMVDNYLAHQAGQELPYPGSGVLKGRRLVTGKGPRKGVGAGRIRRVDRHAALLLATQQAPPAGGPDTPKHTSVDL
jgi:hypothetical protein